MPTPVLLLESLPSPPTIPTAVGRRSDIRKFWRLRDDVVRQKCQRSCLHFCRCWTCRRQVDLGIFSIGVVYCGTFCVLPQRDALRIPHGGAEMCGRSTISKFSPLLLCLSIQLCILLPACCRLRNECCRLTVKPDKVFRLGSNLTVYCDYKECPPRSRVLLMLNDEIVAPRQGINYSTMYHLVNVQDPQPELLCMLQRDSGNICVGGLALEGGLPPDSPGNVACQTARGSPLITCSWEKGRETHLNTKYSLSVRRQNGSETLFENVTSAEAMTIPRAAVGEDAALWLTVTAFNHLGASSSELLELSVQDIVIPETPHIIYIQFENDSKTAVLHWNTTELSGYFETSVRLRSGNGSWKAGSTADLHKNAVQVRDLRPLSDYEFQMRACSWRKTPRPGSAAGRRLLCSACSQSARGRSPGKGPSQRLHVWRLLGGQTANGGWMVTVLWKPPSVKDYSGELQQYNIWTEQWKEVSCPAASNQCTVSVPGEARSLSVSAVTTYGTSPPAHLPLTRTGGCAPVLEKLVPAGNGSRVSVFWSWQPGRKKTAGAELLRHYVIEWADEPAAELQWQTVERKQNGTVITGLTAGARYNISLFAVTSSGVSNASSALVYSKEEKPASGPRLSVLLHEAGRIHIQWEELPLHQRRGFIRRYTVYMQPLDASSEELNVSVAASEPRHKWLDCPEGALALEMTASTSAGEGRHGPRVSSRPSSSEVGMAIMIVFVVAVAGGILTNIMCWGCVRRRIKEKCASWRPAWFNQPLPKLGNSLAIRLLKSDTNEPTFSIIDDDPPLSPIMLPSSVEAGAEYPNVHMEAMMTEVADSQPELDISYRPQVALPSRDEEATEAETEEEDDDWEEAAMTAEGVMGLLPGGFLSSVEVDFSDTPLELIPDRCAFWPKSLDLAAVLNADRPVKTSSPPVDLPRREAVFSQNAVEARLVDGYLPQVSGVGGDTQG
ncbi:interleukin-23 receptor isoform X2 [Nelusetta ayraudi]|uniref:interleukin-23 receptor isoform X2 n=1 Tax=Nelusetta ayraudi TaxID=303726 RepID=UPI003F71AA06